MTLICVPIMVEDEASARRDARLAAEFGADLIELRVDSFFSGGGRASESAGESEEASTGSGPGRHEEEVRAILRLLRDAPLPCIVTCRPAADGEGGHYDADESSRVALFERLGAATPPEHPPRYIDVELAAYTKSANVKQKVNLAVQHPAQVRDLKTSLILSSHDFNGRPADLLRRLATMREQPAASILKIAYRARSLRDNLELFDLMREADRPMIALGMGEFGLISRVLAPKFGGFLTFASLRPASATAPGQPTVAELLDRYRFRSIKPSTRVYGVIGYPVSHSISPDVHNAGFDAIGEWEAVSEEGRTVTHDDRGVNGKGGAGAGGGRSGGGADEGRGVAGGVYLPLPVPEAYEHFKATLGALIDDPRLHFGGCSVTIPHKEHLVRLAGESLASGDGAERDADGRRWTLDAVSRTCGAANTLVVHRNEHGLVTGLHVHNTDAAAALSALAERMGIVRGRGVAILGAGGAARALACELVIAGARVTLFNRNAERAVAVADELTATLSGRVGDGAPAPGTIAGASLSDVASARPDVIINCTPVGMKSGPDPSSSPVSADTLRACRQEATTGVNGRHVLPIVMDTVYNPVRTPLVQAASEQGLVTVGGLAMFVRQAEAQFELWTQRRAPGVFQDAAERALGRG